MDGQLNYRREQAKLAILDQLDQQPISAVKIERFQGVTLHSFNMIVQTTEDGFNQLVSLVSNLGLTLSIENRHKGEPADEYVTLVEVPDTWEIANTAGESPAVLS